MKKTLVEIKAEGEQLPKWAEALAAAESAALEQGFFTTPERSKALVARITLEILKQVKP